MNIKYKKGFTLIETIVCLAIVGFTGVFITAYMITPIKIYGLMSEKSSSAVACNAIMSSVHKKIRYAKNISISSGKDLSYQLVTKEGIIDGFLIEGNTFADKIYKQRDINITFSRSGNLVTVTVFENKDGKEINTLEQTIKCINEELTV